MLKLMLDTIITSISLLALFLSIGALLFMLLQQLKTKQDNEKRLAEEIDKIHNQSFQVVDQATKKAQVIIGEAQSEEVKIVEGAQSLTKSFEDSVQKQFMDNARQAQQIYNRQLQDYNQIIKKAQDDYVQYLTALKSNVNAIQNASIDHVKIQTNSFFDHFEEKLANFLADTEEKTLQSIDMEVKSARELINTYKSQQLKLVDENIIAVLEKTLSIVLAKKLTLNDQVDLVYEALEKAKLEQFIV